MRNDFCMVATVNCSFYVYSWCYSLFIYNVSNQQSVYAMKSTSEMLKKKNRLVEAPKSVIIEQTALQFAAVWYDAARSSGLKSTKGQKQWARDNFVKFIPHAIEHLTSLLGQNHITENIKRDIHDALVERANDPEMQMLDELHLKNISEMEH